MTNLIVAFPKQEDAKNIRNILARNGFPVSAVCTSGAQVLQNADDLRSGIVVCGYRLTDMIYSGLKENLPEGFDMLLIASARYADNIREERGLTWVRMPLKVYELTEAVRTMSEEREAKRHRERRQPVQRSSPDRAVIGEAKRILMEKKGMTEEEAHRYLQKKSMDNGVNLLETAQNVVSLMGTGGRS